MSLGGPWWTREAAPRRQARIVSGTAAGTVEPRLVEASARQHLAVLRSRIAAFTPEWTRLTEEDAGVALVKLFGSQLQPLLDRLNRLPEKALVETLRLAGIERLPGTAARALLEFSVADGAPRSVLVPRGFQVGAPPADGSRGLVTFETERDLYVAPGKIAEVHLQDGRSFRAVADFAGGAAFRPFGDRPLPGRALLVGIAAPVAPEPFLALGIGIAAAPGAPPAVAAGGLTPLPAVLPPVLRWEVLDGAGFTAAEVVADETANLARSGVVELRAPRRWRAGRPAGVEGDKDLFWVRVRLLHGAFAEPPSFSRLSLNLVPATAAATVRNEVLEHVPGSPRAMRLARTPVLPGSLVLEVVEGSASGDIFDLEAEDGQDEPEEAAVDARRWTEVADLAASRPRDRVYTLDPATGEVIFGDGLHGAALPPGFRHVRAASYQVGGGRAGAVDAGQIATLIHSVPFLNKVTNPLPASGGGDAEPRAASLLRGPQEIRARGRAVTTADYELLALRATGADVARAHAVPGLHPELQGPPIPGVVGLFVVPPDRGEGPPTADEPTLAAVAGYLARQAAPAGAQVVVAAARYHRIRAELAAVLADPAGDAGLAVRRLLAELDLYFHPLTGGEDGLGWPFGGPVRYSALLRRLLGRVPEVAAIPRLNLVLDGVRLAACLDATISPHGLLWPEGHEVVLEREEREEEVP